MSGNPPPPPPPQYCGKCGRKMSECRCDLGPPGSSVWGGLFSQQPQPQPTSPQEIERIGMRSGLPPHMRYDGVLVTTMTVDHEAAGELEIDYRRVPFGNRSVAVFSLMGALTERLAMAYGQQWTVRFLRGVANELERREGA